MPELGDVVALPGAGSSGSAWDALARTTGAVVHPLEDHDTVLAIVGDVERAVRRLGGSPVLVGASLGAVVALEVARRLPVRGLVLMASGLGVRVSDEVLDRVEHGGDDVLTQVAHAGVPSHRSDLYAERERDLRSRGIGVLSRHLRALAAYVPEPLEDPPPTVVVAGMQDKSVGLGAHLRLAAACRGYLRPLEGVGHSAYLEAPAEVATWVWHVARMSRTGDSS